MQQLGAAVLLLVAMMFVTVARAQPERPVHVVIPGDTLYGLATAYGTTVAELKRVNALQGDLLRVGTELAIPGRAAGPAGYRPYLAGTEDTWESVGAGVGLKVDTLLAANPAVPFEVDLAGRLLLIPPGDGATYWAQAGETAASMAARFGVDAGELAAMNGFEPAETLIAGQPVLLPAGISSALAHAVSTRADTALATVIEDPRSTHRAAQNALLLQAPTLLIGLAWPDTGFDMPVYGRLSSSFGWRNISVGGNRFHGGVDIAAPPGTPIRVSRPGVVTRTGWIGAYGNAVYVEHGDGSQTRYAHLRAIYVTPGEVLIRGDLLGEVGSTGASTGPHLHFEVRIEGRAVDPLAYLEFR
jgi:murein DD-endopeptidase MepM/ murein hydrolase activator NlpD